MDPPASGNVIKLGEIEEAKEGGPLFHCDLSDSALVYKIAQALLPGLASACVDNTTGDLLRSAGSVAVDIRRDLVDYVVQRSETFVAESVVLEGSTETDVSDNPFDIISNFIDDFAASKRNFLSKVSGWVLSDRREDRIDDLIQEMELDGFWLIARREAVAQTLLKNVDFKNDFHCNMKFKASKELDEHRFHCSFRTIICTHEGCDFRFSACHLEQHESVCPFKIIPCEQGCPDSIMRREMDRHCITVCTMKLVNCPFYQVGCHSTIPQCKIDDHRSGNFQSHILHVLRLLHNGFSEDSLKKRLDEIEKLSSPDNLASLRDARSLTNAVKNYERCLGPIEEIKVEPEPNVEDGESKEKKERSSSSSSEENLEIPRNNEEVLESTVKEPEPKKSPEKSDSVGSPSSERGVAITPPSREEDSNKSPTKKEKHENPYPRKEENVVTQFQPESRESSEQDEKFQKSATEHHRQSTSSSNKSTSPVKRYEMVDLLTEIENLSESSSSSEEHGESPTKKDVQEVSHFKGHGFENSLQKELIESLDQDQKFQKSATETQKHVNSSTEQHRRSTSSSDKSTSPVKRYDMVNSSIEMDNLSESSGTSGEHEESPTKKDVQEVPHFKRHELSSPDNLASVRDTRSLTEAVKNSGRSSSSSSEENLESPRNNQKVLESIIKDSASSATSVRVATESPSREEDSDKSPKEKENTMDSPGSERELAAESPLREEHFYKSPKSKEKHANSSPRKEEMVVTQTQLGEKFQKSSTETQNHVNHSTELHRQSTSSSDKSTSPVKRYEMVDSPTKMVMLSESSDSSEEPEKSPTKNNVPDLSHFKRHDFENFFHQESKQSLDQGKKVQKSVTETQKRVGRSIEQHRQSTSSSDKSTSPVKRHEMEMLSESSDSSEESDTYPTKKDVQEVSHFKKHEPENSLQLESSESIDQNDIFQKSATETQKQVHRSTELQRQSTSSSDKSTSPAKRNNMVDIPTELARLSGSSDNSEEPEDSPTKKYIPEVSQFKRHDFEKFFHQESTQSLDQDKIFQKSATETQKRVDHSTELQRQSTSSSDNSTSPAKRNNMVDIPTELARLSDSSDNSEEPEESPTKKDVQEVSHFKMHELENPLQQESPKSLDQDAFFQKSATKSQKQVDRSAKLHRQSTSSSDNSTSPAKGDDMLDLRTQVERLSESSGKSEEREESLENFLQQKSTDSSDEEQKFHKSFTETQKQVDRSAVLHRQSTSSSTSSLSSSSTSSSDKSTSPVKMDDMVNLPTEMERLSESSGKSEEDEESPTKKDDLEDSHFEIHELEDSLVPTKSLHQNEMFQKSATETQKQINRFAELHRQSTSSSDKSTSPVKRFDMVDSPTEMESLSSESSGNEREQSPNKKDGQEDSPFKRHELTDSLVKVSEPKDSHVKRIDHESSSDDSDEQE